MEQLLCTNYIEFGLSNQMDPILKGHQTYWMV